MGNKVKQFLITYKVYILSVLLVIFMFKSCSNSGKLRRTERKLSDTEVVVDSLKQVLNQNEKLVNDFDNVVRQEKIKLLGEYDNYISSKNRGEQLMELHMMVKNDIKKLRDVTEK